MPSVDVSRARAASDTCEHAHNVFRATSGSVPSARTGRVGQHATTMISGTRRHRALHGSVNATVAVSDRSHVPVQLTPQPARQSAVPCSHAATANWSSEFTGAPAFFVAVGSTTTTTTTTDLRRSLSRLISVRGDRRRAAWWSGRNADTARRPAAR